MKVNTINRKLLFFFILLGIWCLYAGCDDKRRDGDPEYNHRHGQLLVYYKDGNDQIRTDFKNRMREKYKFTDTTCVCDINLEMWTGDNIEELLQDPSMIKTETARTTSKTTVSGDDTIYLSLNLRYDRPGDGGRPSTVKMSVAAVKGNGSTTVRLAVLDTGLDTAYFEQKLFNNFLLSGNEVDACPQKQHASFAGWNIINNTSNFFDDHLGKHGTTITGLALAESKINTLKILPVKTHDNSGTGYLFHLLCGMKYAQQAKANLINASWGGEGEENNIFIHVLSQLRTDSILFIAASGNEDKNLNNFPVYPARYSKPDTGNVITVTSTETANHCQNANFSTTFVDIGVSGANQHCSFRSPFQAEGSVSIQIRGTSFATAVFSGKLSDRYPFSDIGGSSFKNNLFTAIPGSATGAVDVRTQIRYQQQ